MSGTETKGCQASPIRWRMAKDAPRRDWRADTMTLASKTILYIQGAKRDRRDSSGNVVCDG